MRSGVKIIAFTSIAMAVLTAWQVIPSKGWLEGILWGLLFGILIWAIFFGNILLLFCRVIFVHFLRYVIMIFINNIHNKL